MKKRTCRIDYPAINEICLFRHLNWYLNHKTKSVLALETHGHKGLVEFSPCYGISNPVIKEIADLQIICYDPISRSLKLSFLQAKFHRKNLNPNGLLSFIGDALQWDLLYHRPQLIRSVSKLNFPQNILSHSTYDSIAGFGIFYYNRYSIDLVYSAASLITPHKFPYSRTKCQRTLYRVPPNSTFQVDIRNIKETLARANGCGYIDSLLRFEIGSPFQKEKSIVAYIFNLLSLISQSTDIEGSIELAGTMLDSLDDEDRPNDFEFNNTGYMNTLLILSNPILE